MSNKWKTPEKISYLTGLQCSDCGIIFSAAEVHTFCPDCQSPLIVNYDLNAARQQVDRDEIHRRRKGIWRWHELLPVREPQNIVTLGEGDAALLHLPRMGNSLGLTRLFVKDESSNPTGSFKARGLSVAVSKAKELGVKKVILPTAGSAGGTLAAYVARAGLQALIYMPKDAPSANIREGRLAGAEIVLVDGLISDAAGMAGETARREGWFDVSIFKEPYRLEGKKIMGYELAESFDWELPEVILYPTGAGTGLIGMWKAFKELEQLGWLKNARRPRLVSVQAEGCAPVVKAFQKGAAFCDFWIDAHTLAAGLCVPKSFADRLILANIRESNGTAVVVSDEAILEFQKSLAALEGVFAALEGAATLAALQELVAQRWIQSDERVVIFNTGSGLKYLKPAG
jgi:threonine synthase